MLLNIAAGLTAILLIIAFIIFVRDERSLAKNGVKIEATLISFVGGSENFLV